VLSCKASQHGSRLLLLINTLINTQQVMSMWRVLYEVPGVNQVHMYSLLCWYVLLEGPRIASELYTNVSLLL
jgi:hypothetical protein